MTPTVVSIVLIGALYATGVFLVLDRSLTRVLLGILLLGNATNIMLLMSGGAAGLAPILPRDPGLMSDPLSQAMILTAIVITLGMVAFVLSLIYRIWSLDNQDRVEDDEEDKRVRESEFPSEQASDDETNMP